MNSVVLLSINQHRLLCNVAHVRARLVRFYLLISYNPSWWRHWRGVASTPFRWWVRQCVMILYGVPVKHRCVAVWHNNNNNNNNNWCWWWQCIMGNIEGREGERKDGSVFPGALVRGNVPPRDNSTHLNILQGFWNFVEAFCCIWNIFQVIPWNLGEFRKIGIPLKIPGRKNSSYLLLSICAPCRFDTTWNVVACMSTYTVLLKLCGHRYAFIN